MFQDFFLSSEVISEVEEIRERPGAEFFFAAVSGRSGIFYHKQSCEPSRMIYFPTDGQEGRIFNNTLYEVGRSAARAAKSACNPHKALPVKYYNEFLKALEICSSEDKNFKVEFYSYTALLNELRLADFLLLSEAKDWFQRVPSYLDCQRDRLAVEEFGGQISLDKIDLLRQKYPYRILSPEEWPNYEEFLGESSKAPKFDHK